MGCILYISTFWQDESHLYCQCHHANFAFFCAKLPSTVSVLCMWHLGRENLTLEAAFNTYRFLRDTAAPRKDQVEFSYSKGDPFPSLGLWRCYVNRCCCLRKAWPKVFSSRVTHFCVLSTFMGYLLVPFSIPPSSIPPGVKRVLCAVAFLGTGHERRVRCEEGWRKRAPVNHLKYTIILQGVD